MPIYTVLVQIFVVERAALTVMTDHAIISKTLTYQSKVVNFFISHLYLQLFICLAIVDLWTNVLRWHSLFYATFLAIKIPVK